jgi:hypothetical protein
MTAILKRKTYRISVLLLLTILFYAFATASLAQERHYSSNAWSFGVMGDTQWTASSDPSGANPDRVSVSIINQINDQFIKHKVKFVFQMGDGENLNSEAGIAASATAAKRLYNAGIGFFPMRGNHSTSFVINPAPPDLLLPVFRSNYPQTRGFSNTFGTRNFASPTSVSTDLDGLSYSFDYGPSSGTARFIILDVMAMPSANHPDKRTYVSYGYPIGTQQNWITSRLKKKKTQAFVLTHQPLMAENHADTAFGGLVNENVQEQNAFMASLQSNGVRYYIAAHDHLNQRSIISSPDGFSQIEELIAAPACTKFYIPSMVTDPKWNGQKDRERPIAQETNNIGFYIYTVDGARVNVDYYADATGHFMSDNSWPWGPAKAGSLITPTFNFVKRDSWGYGLNGKEFLITQGASYTIVTDTFNKTTARILSGINQSKAVDSVGRPFTKKVTTGWSRRNGAKIKSDTLSIWGMADLGSGKADTYTLSLSFKLKENALLRNGKIGIATVDSNGNWVNAVSKNSAGKIQFVLGRYNPEYGPGTYGVDPVAKTAWAVIDYNADFAVAEFTE